MSEAQTCLKEYKNKRLRIQTYELQIQELRASQIMASKENDGMPHGKNNHTDLSNYAARLEELEKKKSKAIEEMMLECERVVALIDTVDDEIERMVLTLKYINDCRWEEIWQQVEKKAGKEYTLRRIYQIHGNALQHVKFF